MGGDRHLRRGYRGRVCLALCLRVLVDEGGAGLYRWKRLLNGTSAQEVTSGTPSAVASMGTAALSSVHGVGAKANKYGVAASIADLRCERRVS